MAKKICIVNQKGGVGKTTTTVNLGIGLARAGKRVLLVDVDPQGSMTTALGIARPDELDITIADLLKQAVVGEKINSEKCILHHKENVDFIPSNIMLSDLEVNLINVISRETVLKRCIEHLDDQYDYILFDCMPCAGILVINALATANEVIIPVQADYLSTKGLTQLLRTIQTVKQQVNPNLHIAGILLTMVEARSNFTQTISKQLRDGYSSYVRVFDAVIPRSVRAKEAVVAGTSIYEYDPKGKVAAAYQELTDEVIANG